MKVLMINVVCGVRSTGRICTDLAKEFEKKGDVVRIAYGRECVPKTSRKYAIRIGNELSVRANALLARIFDNEGLNARISTKRFIKWAERFSPDVLWLHNIHGYYINYEMLFKWIKSRPQMEVKWTLHDCWAFTGHCSYFSHTGCTKWKKKCDLCPLRAAYPKSILKDNSKINFARKKKAFCGVKRLTIITPSEWLAKLVKESFLAEYNVLVKNNHIDTSVFRHTESNFKKQHGIENKKIILGVASVWSDLKGLSDFLKLSYYISREYVIVLVGLNKKQISNLPANVIGIERTNNASELAAIYSAAYVFLNLTYEDNYPTVNLEAIACETPVITYDTGGSPESASEYGIVVPQGDLEAVRKMLDTVEQIKRK